MGKYLSGNILAFGGLFTTNEIRDKKKKKKKKKKIDPCFSFPQQTLSETKTCAPPQKDMLHLTNFFSISKNYCRI